MRLEWSQLALQDIADAEEFLTDRSSLIAQQIAERVRQRTELLQDQPLLGRPGRVPGTRELVIVGTPFIAVYQVRRDALVITRLLHHARRWS